ncbi:MAG TPA: hypothetical protein IAA32_02850 [Candidatus Butyricicoccus stercorigallinarum]|nr:hypothetical protein [Candidatus Butyricicoccus stercorigallinarum]
MTGREVYEQALALLGMERGDVPWMERTAAGCLRQMLADRLYEQGALCRAQGRDAPRGVPALGDLDEEIAYDELFVRECFPYGLGALLVAEDDRTMFNWLMSEYERRAAYYAPCTQTALREADE